MRPLFRRLTACFAAALVVCCVFPCQASAVSTSASSAILMDVDSGRVIYEQNADAKMLIASTTKIMTALVALEQGELDEIVTVSREAAWTEGSSMYLKEGEELTLETLLYGLLLCSGNDAAVAIAEHIAGSEAGFARLMNEKAEELLEVFGLADEKDYISANLPYGKQRKLEIARALATSPKLLLLDEPAAGMNPNETQELMDTIEFVRENFDMTVLLIEHDMRLVAGICEELTVLNFGTVLAQGKTKDVLNNPEVIKAYLGE